MRSLKLIVAIICSYIVDSILSKEITEGNKIFNCSNMIYIDNIIASCFTDGNCNIIIEILLLISYTTENK